MARDKVRCPWCNHVMQATQAKVARLDRNGTTVVERRCSACGNILAAYVEAEGDFLPRMRTF